MKLTKKDKILLYYLQFDFPLVEQPFGEIAKKTGLCEEDVIRRVKKFKRQGLLRYIGPLLNAEKLNFESTLIAMQVPKKKLKKVVKTINALDNVSHNYLRDDEKFNLWFTLTAPGGELSRLITKIKKKTGIKNVLNLKKEKVFKLDTRFKL